MRIVLLHQPLDEVLLLLLEQLAASLLPNKYRQVLLVVLHYHAQVAQVVRFEHT